jgi:hypothetical protein
VDAEFLSYFLIASHFGVLSWISCVLSGCTTE